MENLIRALTDLITESKQTNKTLEQFKEIYTQVKTHELTEDAKDVRILEQLGLQDAMMVVKEYDTAVVGDISIADKLNHAQQLGMKLRQLEIQLKGGSVVFEGGQFMYSSGALEQGKVNISLRELVKGTLRKQEGDSFFRPSLTGTGKVVLDGRFSFISLFPIKTPSRLVLEKGIYLASIGEFEFKITKNLQAGYFFFSDKALLQTDLRGRGIVALELPVPMSMLEEYEVTEHAPFRVDGDFVLMWSGNLKKRMVPAHGILGSLTSGTGMVEEYVGTGKVWVAPTLDYFNLLKDNHLKQYDAYIRGQDTPPPPEKPQGILNQLLSRYRK